jgi:hypothetical protein
VRLAAGYQSVGLEKRATSIHIYLDYCIFLIFSSLKYYLDTTALIYYTVLIELLNFKSFKNTATNMAEVQTSVTPAAVAAPKPQTKPKVWNNVVSW